MFCNTDFTSANLTNVNLRNTNLTGAVFCKTNMSRLILETLETQYNLIGHKDKVMCVNFSQDQ